MSVIDHVAICVEIYMNRYCALFGERVHWIDPYESLNAILPNYQSSWFLSQLSMWSFHLRYDNMQS